MMAGWENPIYGETTDLGIIVTEADNQEFTITSATFSAYDADGNAVRTEVPCVVDGRRAYVLETFGSSNGYAPDACYQAQFEVVITIGSQTWVRRFVKPFRVLGVPGE